MKELNFYAAMSRIGGLDYRMKIMLMAFLGTHVPLLALIGYYVASTTNDVGIVWATLGVALVATLAGTGVTLFVLNKLLQPVLLTSKSLRAYTEEGRLIPLPTGFTDQAGTLMADATRTLTRLDATLETLKTIDAATGLGNREKLLGVIGAAVHEGLPFAVTALRVTNYDRLVAAYDQQRADGFMHVLAERLVTRLGVAVPPARIDGSSFAFVRSLDPADGAEQVQELVAAMIAELAVAIPISGVDVVPELTAGIALFPDDGSDAAALLGNASAAASRYEPRAVAFHSTKARDAARDRFALEQDLRRAIADEQFRLHFQPVVDVAAGKAVGAEALIRWQHPERGLIPPGLFIPAAERSGLIDEIGRWVIREACAQVGRWQSEAMAPLRMAINLSARQFLDPRLTADLSEALAEARVAPDRLEIELTESVAMADYDHTRRTFGKLSDLGLSIAIDDFGTGYASLSYLRKLPFDKLKIDREFVSNVDREPGEQAICNAIIALSKGLGLRVLAEGAERAEEVAFLSRNGCDLFQGYYFSRPVAADDMGEALADIELRLAEHRQGSGGERRPGLRSA